ncbi:MAG: DUF262 domain-containing protein [Cetobacterium sp.]
MKEKLLTWIKKNGIDLKKEDNKYYILLDGKDHIEINNDRFKILSTTDEWKWNFGRNRVIKYTEDNYNKLISYITEISEENKCYNYEDTGVYVREITSQVSFSSLMTQLEKGYFVIPKSQRNYVWSREKIENLAISLIRGMPIPPLYAYRNNNNQLAILDGQQRLMSLYLYSKGLYIDIDDESKTKFEKSKTKNLKDILKEKKIGESKEILIDELEKRFKLKETNYRLRTISKKIENINYSTLQPEIKALVDFRPITIIEILVQNTNNKEEVYYNIFGNLNQGGEPLKNQELRDGIYRSDFYDMLHEINDSNNKAWRNIYGSKHNRGRDIELLLRFVATEYMFNFVDDKFNLGKYIKKLENGNEKNIGEFQNSYPKLLNDFSKMAMLFTKEEVGKYKIKILKFLEKIKYNNKIDNLLLESLYIVDSKIEENYTITSDLIKRIAEDKKYKSFIGAGSSAKSKVENRLNKVYEIVKEYIGGNNE